MLGDGAHPGGLRPLAALPSLGWSATAVPLSIARDNYGSSRIHVKHGRCGGALGVVRLIIRPQHELAPPSFNAFLRTGGPLLREGPPLSRGPWSARCRRRAGRCRASAQTHDAEHGPIPLLWMGAALQEAGDELTGRGADLLGPAVEARQRPLGVGAVGAGHVLAWSRARPRRSGRLRSTSSVTPRPWPACGASATPVERRRR